MFGLRFSIVYFWHEASLIQHPVVYITNLHNFIPVVLFFPYPRLLPFIVLCDSYNLTPTSIFPHLANISDFPRRTGLELLSLRVNLFTIRFPLLLLVSLYELLSLCVSLSEFSSPFHRPAFCFQISFVFVVCSSSTPVCTQKSPQQSILA